MLHGPSTLAWSGLRGFDLSQIHVVRRRGTTTTGCSLAVVHRVRGLSENDVVVIRGMPTVTALRAIWSEASRYCGERALERGVRRVGRLLDDAHGLKLVTWTQLQESVLRLGGRGRAGSMVMRAVAAKRQPGTSPTESSNEDRFEEILETAGARSLRRQVLVGGETRIGRADFRDPDLPMVVEVNSLAFHSSPSDREADLLRYSQLVDAGFCVVVVWEGALWSAPHSVLGAVAEGRRRAGRDDPAVVHTLGCPWPKDPHRIVIGDNGRSLRG